MRISPSKEGPLQLDLEQLSDGYVLVGVEGNVIHANRAALELFEVDSNFKSRLLAWVRSKGDCHEVEALLDLGFGMFVRARGQRAREGCWIQLVRVITHRGEGQENDMLREMVAARQLAEIESVYANAPVGLCVLDTELRWVRINHLLAEMNGIPAESHIGKRVREVLPDLAEQAERILKPVIEKGEAVERIEIVGETPARPGVVRTWVESFFPLKDTQGQTIGVNVVCEEVTERRRVEAALRDSEQRFRLATEAMQGIVYDWDLGSGTLRRSRGLLVVLGYEEREIPPTPEAWRALVHPDDLKRVGPKFDAALARGAPLVKFEYRARHKDGRWVYLNDHGVVLYDGEGKAIRVVGCTVSVDERRQAEEGLRRATAQLQQANERLENVNSQLEAASFAKDRFLAVLSHELRTPLTPVLLALDDLLQREGVSREVKEALGMVRRNIELETHLIDDLLDLSRVVAGKLRLAQREVSVHEVVRHAAEMVEPEMREKGIALRLELHARREHIHGDPARLQQVIWNLLKNASKFTRSGGEVRVVTRQSETEESGGGMGMVVVEVRDTGVGIARDTIGKIFDAFEQGNPGITREFGGLGLGLAISKAIVDLHGGTIRAESDGEGKGALFMIGLPVVETTDSKQPVASGHVPAPAPEGIRILLVEDHGDTARVLAKLLELSGFRVKVAGSVGEALGVAEGEGFDLVVSDLGLPDGTGHELMSQLRKRYGLKGIALSGFGMEEDLKRSQEAGFVEHLTKPVSAAAIRSAIARVGTGGAQG